MYIKSIKFKREQNSDWESGYYIGRGENSNESTFLDCNYKPLEKSENGCSLWDYKSNLENYIELAIPEKEDFQDQ